MAAIRYALIFALVFLPASPFATTFPVTKTDDTNDGTCDADCSLREAIEAANANPGADDVPVPAGNYLLALGQLVVLDAVSIAGAGQTYTIIDGNRTDRVFDIQATSGVVAISSVTIQNAYGYEGGGIRSYYSDLNLTDSTVSNNIAFEVDRGGGGIWSRYGELTLSNSTVSNNNAAYGYGGGIWNSGGKLTLSDSTVSDNNAAYGDGGGIWSSYGDITLANSTVSGNTRGGIRNISHDVTLTNSTVSGNNGSGILSLSEYGDVTLTNSTVNHNAGAGISNRSYYANMTLTNSTVSGNTSGGISNYSNNLTITNSTVTNNDLNRSSAGIYNAGDSTVINSVVAGNGTTTRNCNGALNSLGYNLTDDDSCGFTAPGDLIVADPMLGPLADNGGPTETHGLLPGSPAIDAGSMDCPPPDTDQRGVARPRGSACDIGAVEYLPEPHHATMIVAGVALLAVLYRRHARGSRPS